MSDVILAEEAERNPDSQLSQNMEGMEMTGDQCKDAILDLMGHDGEQAVFEWFKSVYPGWFKVTA